MLACIKYQSNVTVLESILVFFCKVFLSVQQNMTRCKKIPANHLQRIMMQEVISALWCNTVTCLVLSILLSEHLLSLLKTTTMGLYVFLMSAHILI